MYGCFTYIYVCEPHVFLVPEESEENIEYSGTGVADGYEPHEMLGLKPESSEREEKALTTEPSLKSE